MLDICELFHSNKFLFLLDEMQGSEMIEYFPVTVDPLEQIGLYVFVPA
jgi:hypothetical protein